MVSYISSPASHYRALIETYLSYGNDAARTHLRASHWWNDNQGEYEKTTSTNVTAKTDHKIRAEMFGVSKAVQFCTPLHSGK